ncbi:MAG: MFS transporter [Cumulibacter sp.]
MTFSGYRHGEPGFRRVSIALFAGSFASFGLLYAPQAMLPSFSREFDLSAASAALSVSVTTIALAVGMLIAGQLSEVIGRTTVMRIALVGAAVITAATAAAGSWGWLLVLRALTGLALAGFPAVAMAYLREEVHPASLARAAGLYVGGTALGGMTGRLVSGGLSQSGGWHWALLGTGAYGLLCAAVVLLALPASRNFHPAPSSVRSSLSAFMGALREPVLVGLYAIGGLSMGAFVAVFNITGYRLESAPYLLPAGIAGLVFLVYPIGSVSSIVAGRFEHRVGRPQLVPIGFAIAMIGVLITMLAPLWTFVLGMAALTIGFFVVHGIATGWVSTRAHAVDRSTGSASALYLFTYYLGSSVFGTLAGIAWQYGGWDALAISTIMLLSVGLLIALLLRRRAAREVATD